ncbi:MAG: 50S ribosomal protein L29 [bacterium]|nr:50S ribosomal protein L29 [bacterium]
MKKKEKTELGQKNLAELKKMLMETKDTLVKQRMETHTQKIKNVRTVARTRDNIARIATKINQINLKEVANETV